MYINSYYLLEMLGEGKAIEINSDHSERYEYNTKNLSVLTFCIFFGTFRNCKDGFALCREVHSKE